MFSDHLSMLQSRFRSRLHPAAVNTVFTSTGLRRFWMLLSRSASENGRAGFSFCKSGICIDVSAAAQEEEEAGRDSLGIPLWR